jgi:hypothetical protein
MKITQEIKDFVNKRLGYGGDYLDDEGYAFYYHCMFTHNLSSFDADEYAMLNTLIGYDIGVDAAMKISSYLYERDISILDLSENEEDERVVQEAIDALQLNIALDKWSYTKIPYYEYHFEEV